MVSNSLGELSRSLLVDASVDILSITELVFFALSAFPMLRVRWLKALFDTGIARFEPAFAKLNSGASAKLVMKLFTTPSESSFSGL
ncbi:hypothetical protein HGO37_05890 [Rhizobium sp. CG4]|uniref:hypothetical protein n=1 Tax=Rhizobium sp. CG4 TaxID=2726075 RepID=UPI002034259E|nr:hypothetical protein [Rhizobium sp. CG4]MCM2454915.1 hypothetical protein [Rhizobium sp. CG4]